jgi:glutamate dehydrogenase/leucine dehydrogenase
MENMTSIFLFIAGIAISFLGAVTKYLFDSRQDHEKRIQKIEDIQGTEIEKLGVEIKDLKTEVKEDVRKINEKIDILSKHIHNEKNVESQIEVTLRLLLKHLEESDKK